MTYAVTIFLNLAYAAFLFYAAVKVILPNDNLLFSYFKHKKQTESPPGADFPLNYRFTTRQNNSKAEQSLRLFFIR